MCGSPLSASATARRRSSRASSTTRMPTRTRTVPGLMHVKLGPYHVRDVKFVAAFDVDAKKVGFDLVRGDLRLGEQHHQDRRRAADRRRGAARPDPRRHRQVLRRDHRAVRRRSRSTWSRSLKDNKVDVMVSYLPVGSEQADEVLRPVRHRRRRGVRQRAAGVHRLGPGVGQEVRGRRCADRRRRHQEPGRRDHHPPRDGQAVRGPRRHPGPHLPAQRRRQHGLQEHARA